MKSILVLISTLISSGAFAASFSLSYSQQAQQDYNQALQQAKMVQASVDLFLQNTTQDNLANAKQVWTEARKVYSKTEIYRFYGGPIDSEEGPEGLINAWPLDEAYIDYVKGGKQSGIINHVQEYPVIDKELLISLNEKDGEKNISTGWHAIEFLLWGQDFNDNGPGDRPVSDFVVGLGENAERRRQYLKVVTDLLVDNLQSVVDAWNDADAQSFFNTFSSYAENEALQKAFTSLIAMSGDELAIERMFVAYDTQFQEDEHSCFSDTTEFDLLYNFLGVKDLWTLVASTQNIPKDLSDKIQVKMDVIELELTHFKGPFDDAIFSKEGRKQILTIVENLQAMSDDFKVVANELGVQL